MNTHSYRTPNNLQSLSLRWEEEMKVGIATKVKRLIAELYGI